MKLLIMTLISAETLLVKTNKFIGIAGIFQELKKIGF
jgi:hypothetical protein